MRKAWKIALYSMAILTVVCFFGQISRCPLYITVAMILMSIAAEYIAEVRTWIRSWH